MRRNLVKAASKSAGRIARSALEGFEKDAENRASPKSQRVLGNVVEERRHVLGTNRVFVFYLFYIVCSHGKTSFLLEAKSNLNDDDDEYIGKESTT